MSQKLVLYCVIPVYNDWDSFAFLINDLEQISFTREDFSLNIVVINDGSQELINIPKTQLNLTLLDLKLNVGHQRAIAIGLQYVFNEVKDYEAIIVMDGDGEDIPSQIVELVEKSKQTNFQKIIFAQRNKRQESTRFKIGYYCYKKIFLFLTGQTINFGNFSLIPKSLLSKVVYQNQIWNHYSGAILQAKIPYDKVLLDRGKRYKGHSKMNFNALILHGLSSIAVYFDYLSLKILRYTLYGMLVSIFFIGFILFKKYVLLDAIPGWASSLILIILGIVLQLFVVTLIVLLMQLSARKNIHVPNAKIYKDFINNIL